MSNKRDHREKKFSETIGEKEDRILKGKQNKPSVWSGFGLFGMVGWSVAVPALAGVALGIWLDRKYPRHFSWTLTCLLAGLVAGCVIAWNWVSKENRDMHKNKDEENE